jgi:hypothetical protein
MEKKGGPGPKQRFAEIGERLKSTSYNSPTRKANRNYLQKYLKGRGSEGSGAVEARKAAAAGLLEKVEAYKVPKHAKTAKAKRVPAAAEVAPPSPTGAVMAAPAVKKLAAKATKKKKSKTPPPPVRPKTPPPKKSDLYTQVEVEGDGNCYYRALYRASAEHEDPKILDRVFTILGADKKKMGSEETGQAALRAAISNYYRTKFLTKTGPYEMLAENYGTMQFKLFVREATGKQAKLYKKILTYVSMPDGKKKFYSDLADVIGTNEEYASEIDYFVISDILDAGGVKVVSTQTSPKSGIFDGKPALYIKRLSYDHYNYWKIKKPRAPAPAPEPTVPAAPKPAEPVLMPKERQAAWAAAAALYEPMAAAAPAPEEPKLMPKERQAAWMAAAAAPAPEEPKLMPKERQAAWMAAAAPPKPAAAKPSSASSNGSTNNNTNEERRHELLEELDKRMDKHTRCIEKCKAYGKKVDATKAALKALGK